jgi:hypothetical protein
VHILKHAQCSRETLGPTPIVIDEFQYVPELVSVVKLVSDRLKAGQRGQFLLTGSADLFSSAKIQESLLGHMARLELYPLSLVERSARSFNLIDCLIDESSFHNQRVDTRQAARIKPSSKAWLGASSHHSCMHWRANLRCALLAYAMKPALR